jgi:hypothetical protein
MHDETSRDDANQLSRRALIGGLGAAGAAAGIAGLASGHVAHAAPGSGVPEVIAPPITGLSYVGLDAFAFDIASLETPTQNWRIYDGVTTGVQPADATPGKFIYASLPIPVGSRVRQLSISYVGQPIPNIAKRVLGAAQLIDLTPVQTTTDAGPGVKSETFNVDALIEGGATYSVKIFCSAGDSVFGVEVGYIPPPQAFVPYTGGTPRVLDTRLAGGAFAANEERLLDLSGALIASGRAAVLNVTATGTAGPGFLALFADGIAYPGNSSVNFSGGGATVANSAIVTMTAGKVKIHNGPAATHVIVDVVGTLL